MSPRPQAPTITQLLDDLAAEHETLDEVVAPLPPRQWRTPTPAAGWDIADSIGHLCFFDEAATRALTDRQGFAAGRAAFMAGDGDLSPGAGGGAGGSFDAPVRRPDEALGRSLEPPRLLARWRQARHALLATAARADPAARIPWYGPSMGLASFLTARLTETWAHGQDVMDALGLPSSVSARLRHVVHLGVAARPHAFAVHRASDPGGALRVEAQAPDGATWTWGPPDAEDVVRGRAVDLALVVTQRRHPADTSLEVVGATATAWLAVAQAFAGPAGPGRPPSAAVATTRGARP